VIWDPTADEEILQNVQSLIATAQRSQPMARALGLPPGAVDKPLAVVEAEVARDLSAQIKLYEPRVTKFKISVAYDGDGGLTPTVRLT